MDQAKNFCEDRQESIIQIDNNNIEQCLNLMQIEKEYQYEIIKSEKTKNELQILMDKVKSSYREKIIKLIEKLKKQKITILFVGGYRSIKVLKFKNGEKLLQTLTSPQRIIYSLIFMNESNLLVSGGESDQILLWNQGKNG